MTIKHLKPNIAGNAGNHQAATSHGTAGVEARFYLQREKALGNSSEAGSSAAKAGINAASASASSARGLYLGIDARYSHFNDYLSDTGQEGDLITAGIVVGYNFTLGHPRWGLDASLGCGYVHRDYERYIWYQPAQDFLYRGSRTRNGFGLTNANVSIAYRLW